VSKAYIENRFRIEVFDVQPSKEALLYCHGGYTPRRLFPPGPGSGTTRVPEGMEVRFYTTNEAVSVGSDGKWVLVGYPPKSPVVETANAGQSIPNYSLTNEPGGDAMHYLFPPGKVPVMDLIRVEGDEKTHLADLWKALRKHNLNYSVLHYFACRVNKRTFNDVIEHGQ
jgi:hypothetical protein